MNQTVPRALPVLLAMLTAVGPLGIDMYLPAMAQISDSLNSDIHHVELSVSTFLLGFATGQILGGPMSDRFGRKPVILLGLTIYTLASAALVWTGSLDQLLLLRVLQALGGGFAVVNSTAIVRDLFQGKDIARVLSMVAIIMMSAPLLAPMIGSGILQLAEWPMIFASLCLYSGILLLVLLSLLPESLPRERRQRQQPWKGYARVIQHPVARRYILCLAGGSSGMFVFITASPYLYLDYFGQSAHIFPWLFGANVIAIMFINRLNMWLLNRYNPQQLIRAGVSLQVAAAVTLLLLSLNEGAFRLYFIVPLMMLFVGAQGLINANCLATIMQNFRNNAGSATALTGVCQFSGGALAGLLWGYLHNGTPVPMMAMMVVTASVAATGLTLAIRAERRNADGAEFAKEKTSH
ncbi:MAG: Bcr/CflA family drug resistance efflux transporter [Oceanospirillaceae bacterium]|nr:Bcr/CflA family drug resistance efflux transporter [Oceanospirillaceae bacterium]|tara:strand:+ start:74205 stop:75428 length:1224 start_codon:yes stop_codon:yes gene_type:complete